MYAEIHQKNGEQFQESKKKYCSKLMVWIKNIKIQKKSYEKLQCNIKAVKVEEL